MVTVKRTLVVKPAEETPSHRIWLSESDQVTPLTHAPTVYFYRPVGDTINSAVELMRDALSQALVKFYPIAGRLHWIGGGRLELDCSGVGVHLIEAESEAQIEDFGDFTPTPEIRKLVPFIDYTIPIHELPIFLVQLTRFKCGGVSLGTAASHVVVDGQTALHFINYWAKITRGVKVDIKVSYDRTLLQEVKATTHFNHIEYESPPLLVNQQDNLEERKKETMVTMLKLTKVQLEKLRSKANQGKTLEARGYSIYEALAAHMWRSACKARGHEYEQPTMLQVVVDCRHRLNPPLPAEYFGNVIFPTMPICMAGEIVTKPLGYTAGKIRESVEKMSDEYVKSAIDFLRNQPDLNPFKSSFHTVGCAKGIFLGNPNFAVTSWLSLPIYEADFGWGKPIYMGPGAIGFDGKSFVYPSREGDGTLNVVLRLQVAHMEAFKKFFNEDI